MTYADAVNSPKRELKIFTSRDGGVEHVSADNMTVCRDYIADWIADVWRKNLNGVGVSSASISGIGAMNLYRMRAPLTFDHR